MVVWAVVIIMFGASFMTVKKRAQPTKATMVKSPAANTLTTYVWYYDLDFTLPVGTTSTVDAELTRLRNTYGGYVFTTQFSTMLSEYEYGYFQYTFPVIIYSDL